MGKEKYIPYQAFIPEKFMISIYSDPLLVFIGTNYA